MYGVQGGTQDNLLQELMEKQSQAPRIYTETLLEGQSAGTPQPQQHNLTHSGWEYQRNKYKDCRKPFFPEKTAWTACTQCGSCLPWHFLPSSRFSSCPSWPWVKSQFHRSHGSLGPVTPHIFGCFPFWLKYVAPQREVIIPSTLGVEVPVFWKLKCK